MFLSMQVMNFIPKMKLLQTCYFKDFDNAWPCISILIVLTCRKLWWEKCWNQLLGKFHVYLYAKNQLYHSFFFRYCKEIAKGDSVIMTVGRGPSIYKNVQIREAEASCRWERSPIIYWKAYPDPQKEKEIEIGRNCG